MEGTLRSRLRKTAKAASVGAFLALDRVGLHVLPKHYYSSVPDMAWLRKHRNAWQKPASLVGVRWNLDEQLEWLRKICRGYYAEVQGLSLYRQALASGVGLGYGPIESQVLHCFIRSAGPRTIIEIGGGVTTALMAEASKMNARDGGRSARLVSIEPFPNPVLRALPDVTHIEQTGQEVSASVFDQLEAGDLLFVDSTHVVKAGSDVLRIYLEIIPRLKPGVFIHIHDIYLPYLYPRDLLNNFFDWQESSLVLALLTNNPRLSVLCCESALHYERAAELKQILSDYQPEPNENGLSPNGRRTGDFPSSLWLKTA